MEVKENKSRREANDLRHNLDRIRIRIKRIMKVVAVKTDQDITLRRKRAIQGQDQIQEQHSAEMH